MCSFGPIRKELKAMLKFIEVLATAVGSAVICTALLAAVAQPLSMMIRRIVYRPKKVRLSTACGG